MSECVIYTDGACSGNPGPGGWAALIIIDEEHTQFSGGAPSTTNNRMELQAVIEALAVLNEPCKIDLYTDSRYVMDGITQWIANWHQNNWRTANGKPVKNQELWQELLIQTQRHRIDWHWVPAHTGHPFNELVDSLAREESSKFATGTDNFDLS